MSCFFLDLKVCFVYYVEKLIKELPIAPSNSSNVVGSVDEGLLINIEMAMLGVGNCPWRLSITQISTCGCKLPIFPFCLILRMISLYCWFNAILLLYFHAIGFCQRTTSCLRRGSWRRSHGRRLVKCGRFYFQNLKLSFLFTYLLV
jgi:hypothetical protein